MKRRSRSWWALLISGALAWTLVGPGVLPANAVACNNEEGIFWGVIVSASDTRFRTHTHGARNLIRVSNRDVNPNCDTNINEAGSTAIERLTNTAVNWAEVGWEKYRDGQFDVFAEWGINGNTLGMPTIGCSFGSLPANWSFRVMNTSGTTWGMATNCGHAGTYTTVGTWSNSGDSDGIAQVETFRRGGTSTGMSDLQQNLNFQDVQGGSWLQWTGMRCYTDDASNWTGHKDSNTQYSTLQSSANC